MEQSELAALQALDAAHHLHPFNDNAALARKGTRILSRGEGVYVWDADGNKLLDAFAGLWCVNLGYGRPELGRVAAEQMTRLAYYNSFFGCTTEHFRQSGQQRGVAQRLVKETVHLHAHKFVLEAADAR